ncbi:hypothetical protein [uncultured Sphingomonas sp.]|uniref:hypothetical protein n=1 Tax=uncultured Sphingomonas sp. TaxID=158754 RepID=UPI0025D94FAF|nr:hypothetical protein [uncultured Sphingomonas sp.]
MANKYRVILQRKSAIEAMFSGRVYRDWYIAQARGWFGWREIKVCPTAAEAEEACREHAGGTLLPGGARIVSEVVRPD